MLNNQGYLIVGLITCLLLFSTFYRRQLTRLQFFRFLTLMTTIFLFYIDINQPARNNTC